MKARVTSLALVLALLGAFLMLPGSSVAQTTNNPIAVPNVPCTLGNASGTFTGGILDITSFAVQNRQLMALGNLSGTCTTATGSTTLTNEPVAIPIAIPQDIAQATCSILDLTLGPVNLDLLGLVVDLSTVHLTITAQPGPGNLLGNLLCAIAGLLDGPGNPLGGIAALLNAILGILQGL